MTTSRRNTIMLWMAYTEFFYPGCELQPGYFYPSMPELFYYTLEDGACIGAAGVDAYFQESDWDGATKKESDADDITLLPNPIHGAHVAPQRCTILRYG